MLQSLNKTYSNRNLRKAHRITKKETHVVYLSGKKQTWKPVREITPGEIGAHKNHCTTRLYRDTMNNV